LRLGCRLARLTKTTAIELGLIFWKKTKKNGSKFQLSEQRL
jgi:hypothetical protein